MRPEEANILVIEDDTNNQQIIADLLSMAGVKHIHVQSSGWQGLKYARERMQRIDLVLLDIQLPAEDGYGVLRRIRESPRFNNTRVVAVTSNVLPQDVVRARAAGFDGFIGKPLDFDRFPLQIHAILRGEAIWMRQ
jgi:two-component system, cell cycle response regulator DivK